MNTSFTQGPWHIAAGGRGESHRITNGDTSIAHVLPIGDDQYPNTRLISMAPELFELVMEGSRLANIFSSVEQTKRFEEAIAKITQA